MDRNSMRADVKSSIEDKDGIVQELRSPLPYIEGYQGEYVDADYVLDLLERAACEIERLQKLVDNS